MSLKFTSLTGLTGFGGIAIPSSDPTEFMLVRDEQTNGTHGDAATAATVHTRVLNTVVYNGISGASLASNQVTLPAGTYMIDGQAVGYGLSLCKAFLYNISDSANELIGLSNMVHSGANGTISHVFGRITIASEKDFELRHYSQVSNSNGLGGFSTIDGRIEAYAELLITKIDVSLPLFHAQDQKATTVNGGTNSSGVNTRTLNTVLTNEITGASLASNQITLPAGTYWVDAYCEGRNVSLQKSFWYNASDTANELIGCPCGNTVGAGEYVRVRGRFTIASEKDFELRHYTSAVYGTYGFGQATGDGTTEVYSDVRIWKQEG